MKGLVFVEFVEMVEARFSPEVADRVIERARLASGGIYTAVGTYDHGELLRMVEVLAQDAGVEAGTLVRGFGEHLFGRFVVTHPAFFDGIPSAYDFLGRVEGYIHVEVRKLYPEAELPSLICERVDAHAFRMRYRSSRPLADLAHGLILGCVRHYGEAVDVVLERCDPDRVAATFLLTRREENE